MKPLIVLAKRFVESKNIKQKSETMTTAERIRRKHWKDIIKTS
jgi:hypothetical protein